MANVSLDKDLFYQYMINNNSTSTMLNALSGNTNTGVQSANDLSSVLGALQNSASFGTGSISDVSTLLSGLEGISTTRTGNSFSDILQSYLQPTSDSAQTTDSVQYINGVESSDNMQAAQQTKTSGTSVSAAQQAYADSVQYDFDQIEEQSDQMVEQALMYLGSLQMEKILLSLLFQDEVTHLINGLIRERDGNLVLTGLYVVVITQKLLSG